MSLPLRILSIGRFLSKYFGFLLYNLLKGIKIFMLLIPHKNTRNIATSFLQSYGVFVLHSFTGSPCLTIQSSNRFPPGPYSQKCYFRPGSDRIPPQGHTIAFWALSNWLTFTASVYSIPLSLDCNVRHLLHVSGKKCSLDKMDSFKDHSIC